MSLSQDIKKSLHGDEYYTLPSGVSIIIPYLKKKGYKNIWCPFDTSESNFVKMLTDEGMNVTYSHVFNGTDFFNAVLPQEIDAVVSNPPFSKRTEVFAKLFRLGLPFAMVTNFNGLFDSKTRWAMFKDNEFEILVPLGRMKFINANNGGEGVNSPNFQSVYVCSKMLDKQIEFATETDEIIEQKERLVQDELFVGM